MHHTVRHHRLVRYHRPTSVGEATTLLAAPDRLAYAGGTAIHHATAAHPVEVVDLQALGLSSIGYGTDAVRVGATTTLHDLARDDRLVATLRSTARAELPSTLRTLGTIGGTIAAAEADSLLLAVLLVHDAEVRFADGRVDALSTVLARGVAQHELIVEVEFATTGRATTAATGRTPADTPIVAAAGRRADDGLRIALTGVAGVPIVVDPNDLSSLDPPSDFRGSGRYRRALARVLAGRVIGELS